MYEIDMNRYRYALLLAMNTVVRVQTQVINIIVDLVHLYPMHGLVFICGYFPTVSVQ